MDKGIPFHLLRLIVCNSLVCREQVQTEQVITNFSSEIQSFWQFQDCVRKIHILRVRNKMLQSKFGCLFITRPQIYIAIIKTQLMLLKYEELSSIFA